MQYNEMTIMYMGGVPRVMVQQPIGMYNGMPYQQGYNPYLAQQQAAILNAELCAEQAVVGAAVGGAAVTAGLCCCLQCCCCW